MAIAEIICVDSSYTIFVSKDEDLSNKLLRHYSDAQDLQEWNKKQKNK